MADRRIIVYSTTSLTGEPAEAEAAHPAAIEPAIETPILLQSMSEPTDWAV
jgi:hypothetical protein